MNACLLDRRCNIQQTGEFEAATHAAKLPNLSRELLLIFNPPPIDGWRERCNPPLPERRRSVSPNQIAQRLEFQHPSAGVDKKRLHRVHVTRSRPTRYRRSWEGGSGTNPNLSEGFASFGALR